MKKLIAPMALTALLLTGCGGETTAPPAPSIEAPGAQTEPSVSAPDPSTAEKAEEVGEVTGHGTYSFQTGTGGEGTMTVPAEPIAEVEDLRIQVDGKEVTYITATIDNREGSDPFDLYQINIYDPAGQQYVYTNVSDYISEIRPADAEASFYNQFIDLANSFESIVQPLQVSDFVMVGPEVPEEIAGIAVSNGYEEIPATATE